MSHQENEVGLCTFAAWHEDANVRKRCTSGGVATALAEMTIAKDGIVVGAAYGDDMVVRHVIVDEQGGLKRIQGVKYVQSIVGREVYGGISEALKQSRDVLFVGLPCQVAAMRKRFGLNPHLLLVDLICFGAPSQNLWRKYVDWLEARRGKRIVCIDPRDKKYGWRRKTWYRYDWDDGLVERRLSLFDPYAQAFYSGIAFRPCCYQCQFRGDKRRVSDLTVGDCWGAGRFKDLRSQVHAGVSIVVCRTKRGLEALDGCAIGKKAVGDLCLVSDNRPYYESPQMTAKAESFSRDATEHDFQWLMNRYHLHVTWNEYLVTLMRKKVKSLVARIGVG